MEHDHDRKLSSVLAFLKSRSVHSKLEQPVNHLRFGFDGVDGGGCATG